MAFTFATITFNLSDYAGVDYDVRRAKGWVTTNLPAGEVIVDNATGDIRVPETTLTINADGTGTVELPVPGDTNPTSWQTTFHFDVPAKSKQLGRKIINAGPFTVTASATLGSLIEEQAVPPTYLSAVTATLDGYVTEAETARDAAATSAAAASAARTGAEAARDEAEALVISDLGTTDGQTRALIEAAGSQTAQALSASFARPATYYVSPTGSDTNGGRIPGDAFATLGAALTAAGAGRAIIQMEPGATFTFGASDSFAIDVAKVHLAGDRTILKWSAAPTAGYAVQLFSSATYLTRSAQWGVAMTGITIVGNADGTSLAGSGLLLGHDTQTQTTEIRLRDGGSEGWTNAVEFIKNAWRISLDNFNVRWGKVKVPTGLTNFGENMQWSNSMFADGAGGLDLGTGEWHFTGCSFDNVSIVVSGDTQVYLDNPHFENPGSGSSGYRMVDLTAAGAAVHMNNVQLVIGQPTGGGNWEMAPFRVDPACTQRGLLINGIHLVMSGFFRPDVTDTKYLLVAGGGRAVVRGVTATDNGNGYALAEFSNAIRNGDAEVNNTTGWTKTGTGTHTVNSDVAHVSSGTYSHKITCASGQTAAVYQDFAVSPGQWIWSSIWRKFSPAAAGTSTGACQLRFFDRANNLISALAYEQFTQDTTLSGIKRNGVGVVPAGTAYCRVQFDVDGGGVGCDYYFDDVIINAA